MIEQTKNLIKRNGLILSIYIILLVIIINSFFVFYYRNVIAESSKIKEQIIAANHGIEFMNKYVNLADMGLRGFMIDQDEKFLTPYREAIANYKENFSNLREVLTEQGFDVSRMDPAEKAIDRYMDLVREMVQMSASGNVQGAIEILKNDPGYEAWKVYSVFEKAALEFERKLSEQVNERYESLIIRMVTSQLVLLLIVAPILLLAVTTIRKSRKKREVLFNDLAKSNQEYIFNTGQEVEENNEEKVIKDLTSNLEKVTGFINQITQGNYDISWEGLNEDNTSLNEKNIAGELTTMRDQMKKVKAEDEVRLWISQGLSNFAEIVRAHQNDFKLLSEKLVSNVVKYLDAQQGGLFIVNDKNEGDKYIELMGCYAYERAKSVGKRIKFGQGLIGQCLLEKETIYLTDVPQDFVNITSGLGDTRPDSILIVPLKLNDNIEGAIELASLKPFKKHEIEFVERLGETIASAITTVRTTENTKMLLERSQQQAEEMRAQEEEMRQNMEELQATQEQMHRKNEEIEELLKKASESEAEIKAQNEFMLREKTILETENAILSKLMEVIPDRVTIKDKKGNYLKVSKSKYKSLKEQGFDKVEGKSDKDMFGEEHFKKSFSVEKEIMTTRKSVFDVEEKIEISKGVSIWGSTSRVPFTDSDGNVLGTIVVTRDITKEKLCAEELKTLKRKN